MTVSVRPSLITFWLRSTLTLTDTMVNGTTPNTIFGLVPPGRNDVSQPLNRISRVQVSTRIEGGALLLLAIFVLLAVAFGTWLWWVLAILFALGMYRAELVITDNGGGTQQVSVSPLDRDQIQAFVSAVNEKLATT